jgi:hypothetical protein
VSLAVIGDTTAGSLLHDPDEQERKCGGDKRTGPRPD